jgi:sialidase-1
MTSIGTARFAHRLAPRLLLRMLCIWMLVPFVFGQESPAQPRGSRNISIYEGRGEYCAWPSIARTADGDLIVMFTRSEEHLGPDGTILLSRSRDNGKTWASPQAIFSTPIDDRESGLTVLSDGRVLGYFWSTFHRAAGYAALRPNSYSAEVLQRWSSFVERPEYLACEKMRGAWNAVSKDGGQTWSKAVPGKDAVHGGIQLKDGSLLVASYREEGTDVGVYAAPEPMATWRLISTVQSPRDDSISLGEPHILQLPSGRIIMMLRATARPYADMNRRCVLWETYSDDGGKTWMPPTATPIWGFPPHLLLLSDGRVLCSYGYRRPPFGERACISVDGVTWDPRDEVVIRDDAPNGDLGYPASVELKPGTILTVYYQPNVPKGTVQQMEPPDPARVKPGILGTIWKVPAKRGGLKRKE